MYGYLGVSDKQRVRSGAPNIEDYGFGIYTGVPFFMQATI